VYVPVLRQRNDSKYNTNSTKDVRKRTEQLMIVILLTKQDRKRRYDIILLSEEMR
jgi:hypothetical protein